jgi:mono/diheme cytochrome c family protein
MSRRSGFVRMTAVALAGAAALLAGCGRGQPRETRDLMIIPDMEFQPKYKAQEASPLFADGRAMRTPPEGTVARGTLKEEIPFYFGRVSGSDTTWIAHNARPVTAELMERGRERFNIYCSPCHDGTGSGHGIVVPYGLVPPPSYHQDRLRDVPDGYLFNVITHGVRTMPSYAAQIPVADRWAIVAYIRALQRAENATMADVPADEQRRLAWSPE